jgi:hypothetical protein
MATDEVSLPASLLDALRDLARGIIAADKCNFHDDVSERVEILAKDARELLTALNHEEPRNADKR